MPAKYNIVIFTFHTSAVPLLDFLKGNSDIKIIILPANRDKKTLLPVILWAKKNNTSYLKTKNCNSRTVVRKVRKIHPDLMVIFNFPQILKKDLLEIARTINFHPGDLPKYRGAHVLNWALIRGEKQIAITCHFVDEGIDSGNIIAKKYLKISPLDDINSLSEKASLAVPILARRVLKKIADPNFSGGRQNLEKSTYYKRRKPEEGKIDWSKKASEIINLVRALVFPWPGAFTYVNRKKIIIEKAKIVKYPRLKSGEWFKERDGLYFGTADKTLKILKIR